MVRNINYKLLLISTLMLLAACSSPKPIFYSSGKDAHIFSCTGATWSGCLRDAGLTCKEQGYEVLEKSSGREYGFFYDNTVKEMVISCGLPVAVAASSPQEPPKAVDISPGGVRLGELGGNSVGSEVSPAKPASKPMPASKAPAEPDSSGLLLKQ